MKHPRDRNFSERRNSAAEARNILLDKFKVAPKSDDPELVARRESIAAARAVRQAERDRLKQERLERERAEAAAAAEAELRAIAEAEAVAKAEVEAREAEQKRLTARVVTDEAERKAKRDAKYAARKARQR
jgi:hypothetical protein